MIHLSRTLVSMVTTAAIWAADQIGDAIKSSGRLDLGKDWFTQMYSRVTGMAMFFCLIGLLCSTLFAAMMRDGREVGRTLARVLTAGVSTGIFVALVDLANQFIDQMCEYLLTDKVCQQQMKAVGYRCLAASLRRPAEYLKGSMNPGLDGIQGTVQVPVIFAVIAGLLMLIAMLVIWVEMLIRRLCIDLAVMVWPLTVAGSVWIGGRAWTRRLTDTILALLMTKLFIILIMKMAASALANIRAPSDLLVAVGLFWLAAFSPFMAMRLIGFIGGAVTPSYAGEGMRQAATAAALNAGRQAAQMIATKGASAGKSDGMQRGGRTPMPSITGAGHLPETPTTGDDTVHSPDTANRTYEPIPRHAGDPNEGRRAEPTRTPEPEMRAPPPRPQRPEPQPSTQPQAATAGSRGAPHQAPGDRFDREGQGQQQSSRTTTPRRTPDSPRRDYTTTGPMPERARPPRPMPQSPSADPQAPTPPPRRPPDPPSSATRPGPRSHPDPLA